MKNHLLFSELIMKSKLRPDMNLAKKIDEIDFPLKHIAFIKKDINNFMHDSFNQIIENHKNLIRTESDFFTEFGTITNLTMELDGNKFEIIASKNKKYCEPYATLNNLVFDKNVLTEDFIDIINKHYIYISLVCAISFDETLQFIESNKSNLNLNKKFIYGEIVSFWTNSFKDDFCYFDIKIGNKFEEREIEYCIIQFYFNYYRKKLLDISKYKNDEWKVLNRIIEDKSNYKWYVIFGIAIWNKIKTKFKNPDESNLVGLKRFKDLDYKVFNKIFDDMINHS